jgi:hypothetical protein
VTGKIFTIGFARNYDPFVGKPDFKKLGKQISPNGLYPGGSVWKTRAEVEAYLAENSPRLDPYKVYGVLADWETQTEQVDGEPFRRLLETSPIVEA